jgi:hypothetical protein
MAYRNPMYSAPSIPRKKKPANPVTAAIEYDNMDFYGVSSTAGEGIITSDTIYHVHCDGDLISGEFSGGGIKRGMFNGRYYPEDGSASFNWNHQPVGGVMMGSNCESTPEILPDGRVRLTLRWYCFDSGQEGIDIIESFADEGKLYSPAVDTPVQTATGGQSVSSS